MQKYLIADIGSTTTKAFLFTENGENLGSSKVPTTIEKPDEDVKVGLRNSISRIKSESKIKIVDKDGNLLPDTNLLITSSAGGGLEMVVVGLTDLYSAMIGRKAALGAGAIITDVICGGDGRDMDDKINILNAICPDMILLVGGTNSNYTDNICRTAEYLQNAKIINKYKQHPIPILYAGNENARDEIQNILEDYPLFLEKNVCEDFKLSDIGDLKKKVIEIFYNHVMEDAPGYAPLKKMVVTPILPTPIAVTKTLQILSTKFENVLLFDIGGATTDVFTIYNQKLNRSVSANVGMSYSIDNVLKNAGLENLKKYLPQRIQDDEILNYIGNKKLHPTSLAVTETEKEIEKAVAINAIQIALKNHFELYKDEIEEHDEVFYKSKFLRSKMTLKKFYRSFNSVIGSGGIVSNNFPDISKEIILSALDRKQINNLFLDKNFLVPHIGVMSVFNQKLAGKILYEHSLLNLNNEILGKPDFPTNNSTYIIRKLKIIKNPEIVIQTKERINKSVGSYIHKNEILFEKNEKYYRLYSLPVQYGEDQEIKWIAPAKVFKKDERIARISTLKYNPFIVAPIDGELLEIKKYAIIFRELSDIDLVKLYLYIPGISKKKSKTIVMNMIMEKYADGLLTRKFKQNEVIISDRQFGFFITSPISGEVVEFEQEMLTITLKRIEKTTVIKSYASGSVIRNEDNQIHLRSKGKLVKGAFGIGRNCLGLFGRSIIPIKNKNDLDELENSDLSGGIAYDIPFKDFENFRQNCLHKKIERPLLILGKFREYHQSEDFTKLCNFVYNKEIFLSAFTRIRAGVERPFIYFEE